ncbi:hypothetical protein SDC9_116180 [bioreactor metagenome]|uniref:Uncharacterized protein n=1 Tax=bioreactor metagenome TaxID=1076179 RepID=A0A645BUW5_9ZZZZ
MVTFTTFPSLSKAAATIIVSTCPVGRTSFPSLSTPKSFELAIDVICPIPIFAIPAPLPAFEPHPVNTERDIVSINALNASFFIFLPSTPKINKLT